MSADMTDPLDSTHEDLSALREEIRQIFKDRQARAARWEPRPMPADWQ